MDEIMENVNVTLDLEEFDEEKMREESADLLELRYITKDNGIFTRTKGGFVALEYGKKKYDRIGVYRTFPVTDPDRYISVREADEKAREIGIIEDINNLSQEQKSMIEEQLRLRYFTPKITRITDIKDEYGYGYFNVITDFGACRFTIRMGGDSVVALSDRRVVITDLDGNRFEIEDIYALSLSERKKLDLFM